VTTPETPESTSFDVRIHQTEVIAGKRSSTFKVRWSVEGKRYKKSYKTAGLAEGFRSKLVVASREGVAFRTTDGLPVTFQRESDDMTFYVLATTYTDLKWKASAATTRRTRAEALAAATMAMLTTAPGKPDDAVLRKALNRWAFNTQRRTEPDVPADIQRALDWLTPATHKVSTLGDPDRIHALIDALNHKLDGTPRAASVTKRWRSILRSMMNYALSRKLLTTNPVTAHKGKATVATNHAIDRRRVANPTQARALLDAVATIQRAGPRLVAFFGCLYYAGLRPEEAVGLRKQDLDLAETGWGTLHVTNAEPYAGREWTNTGANRDKRQLKQRSIGDVRPVPCHPELITLLRHHMKHYGIGPDGRIFRGERNNEEIPKLTITRTWKRAREKAFTPETAATLVAATPYDLRHAACSTWLNAGVPATTVAEWAGHSVEVLLRTYAKCLDGTRPTMERIIDTVLGQGQKLGPK
jgi:integrase